MVPWLTRSTLDHASIQKMSGVARCQQPAACKKMPLAGGAGHRKGAVATGSAYQKLAKKPGTHLKFKPTKSLKSLVRKGNLRRACSSIAGGIPHGLNAKRHLMGSSSTARIQNTSGVGAVDRRWSTATARGCLGNAQALHWKQWSSRRVRWRGNQRRPMQNMPAALVAATSAPAKADMDLLVGSVYETDAQHRARHAGFRLNCVRCVEITWRAHIGRIVSWASARPAHLGGSWRMGCRICVAGRKNPVVLARRAAHMAMNKKQGVCKQAISRASRWAFFQFIKPSADSFSVLSCALKLHAGTDFHRLSMNVLVHESPHSSRLLAPVQPAAPRAGQPAAPMAG
jgi:hypothetical protein